MKNENYSFYDVCEAETIKELMLINEDEFAESTAIKYTKRRRAIDVTYGELKEEVDSLGTYFYYKGMKNLKIAVLGGNSYEWILTFLSITSGNNIAVPLNKKITSFDAAEVLSETECSCIIYNNVYIDIINELKKMNLNVKTYIKFSELKAFIKEGKNLISKGDNSFIYDKVTEDSEAAIFYTSGTMGKSKGVILTQKNIISGALSGSRLVFLGDLTMPIIPFHQAYTVISGVISPLVQKSCILIENEEERILEDFKLFQPDSIVTAPSIVEELYEILWRRTREKTNKLDRKIKTILFLLKHGIDQRKRFKKYAEDVFGGCFKNIISGGSFLEESYVNNFRAFGIEVLNGYGLTECSSVIAVNRNEFNKPGSVGQVIPECNFRISEEGEILIKGSMVMSGYYKDEELTESSFKNKWFKTGDIGYIDNEGFLFIVGRMKKMIVLSSGENISPVELEKKLTKLSIIKEASVYELEGKITAEVFPDLEKLKGQGILNSEKFIRGEVKKFNKSIMKSKRISKVIVRDESFKEPVSSKERLYKIIKMS